jgi:membrane protease YdiL (CAAX protease family)
MALGTFLRPVALASFDVSALPSALTYLGDFAFMVVLGGPLFEEPGWRGFALPRQLHGPLIGGLILGSLWALWHLPGFSVPQMLPPSGTVMDFVTFSLVLIALAYIIQWVFNNAGAACLWPS